MHIFHSTALTYLFGLIGGPWLIVGAFSAKFRSGPSLLRTIVWAGGGLALGWALLGLTYYYGYYHLSAGVRVRLVQGNRLCAGGALALLLVLLTSRAFWAANCPRWFARRTTTERPFAGSASEL